MFCGRENTDRNARTDRTITADLLLLWLEDAANRRKNSGYIDLDQEARRISTKRRTDKRGSLAFFWRLV